MIKVLTRNIITNALFIGFASTLVTSIVMLLFRARGRDILNQYLFFGNELFSKILPNRFLGIAALILHLIIGSLLGWVYILIFNAGILSGILFGLLLWMIMTLILFPVFQQGVFGKKLDKIKVGRRKVERKFKIWIQTLLFHLVYGIVLGYFATL